MSKIKHTVIEIKVSINGLKSMSDKGGKITQNSALRNRENMKEVETETME